MKKKYKILLIIIAIETYFLVLMNINEIEIKTFLGQFVGSIVYFLPIEVLIFLTSKDKNISKIKRIMCKFLFWHIIVCFVGGTSISLYEVLMK